MKKNATIVQRALIFLCVLAAVQLSATTNSENKASTNQVTVVTVTYADGTTHRFTDALATANDQLNLLTSSICEGEWAGPDQVDFTVLNQTTIDTFEITFSNVGRCTTVRVATSPVFISGRSFNVSYNIPTISSGSLTGTFSDDGNQVSGTYSYTNTQCNGNKSGAWSASAEQPCAVLNAPVNLTAELQGKNVVLNWDAPGTGSDTTEISYDDGTAEIGLTGNFDGAELAVRFTPPTYPVNLVSFLFLGGDDVVPDDYGLKVYLDPNAQNIGPIGSPIFDGVVTFNAIGTIFVNFPTPITITSGDFYISLYFIPGNTGDFVVGLDNTTDALRSWLSTPGGFMLGRDVDPDLAGNLIIRAFVTTGAPGTVTNKIGAEHVMAKPVVSSQPVEFAGAGTYVSKPISHYFGVNLSRSGSDLNFALQAAALQGYNIYRFVDSPVPVDPQHLIGQVDANTTTFTDENVTNGTFFYVVTAQYDEGESAASNEASVNVTSVADDISTLPETYRLEQNFPNPFNPATTIHFTLPLSHTGTVMVEIYNIQGEKVKTLVNGRKTAGVYQVEWDGKDERGQIVTSGLYFYRLQTESFIQNKKMILIK